MDRKDSVNIVQSDFQITKLTQKFYDAYPALIYPEILKKQERPYKCILFETHYDYFICIPYRTAISHPYAFYFHNSVRSRKHRSGLDYTKIVIINKAEYIDDKEAMIDRDEYKETITHIEKIQEDALEFVEEYVAHKNGTRILHAREFSRRYDYSPLKYFHRELGIDS